MKKNTTRNLTVAAMLSAVAFILMFICLLYTSPSPRD